MISHWGDSKSLQVNRILLSSLADFNNAVAWMVSTYPISKSSCPFIDPLLLLLWLLYFFESFSHQHQLLVFYWSLSDSKFLQFSRTLPSILVILKVLSFGWSPLVFLFPILSVPLPILWWLYWVHQLQLVSPSLYCSIVFQFPSKVLVLISLFAFLQFTLWSAGTAKSTIR